MGLHGERAERAVAIVLITIVILAGLIFTGIVAADCYLAGGCQ